MGSVAIFSDVERYLTRHVRGRFASIAADPGSEYHDLAVGVFVSASFPEDRRGKAVVIRDDGGPTTSRVTKESTIGVTILTDRDHSDIEEASNLARLTMAIIADAANLEPDNPIAVVRTFNGPLRVPETSGQPRYYFTAELGLAGTAFTP